MLALAVFNGAASCNVAIEFGITGPNSTNGMSCASGAIAVGDGWRMIRDGHVEVVLSGGVEAPLAPLCFGAFAIIRAMSTRNDDPHARLAPFRRGRDGFVMGEGTAVLVLEELEHARARGARIYAEVLGLRHLERRASHDGAPAGRRAGRPRHAPRAGGGRRGAGGAGLGQRPRIVHPAQRQHGEPRDPHRAGRARGQRCGERHQGVPRALPGRHGAVEAAISALAIQRGWIPPPSTWTRPASGCDLAVVTGEGRHERAHVSPTRSASGINAALLRAGAGVSASVGAWTGWTATVAPM
jgi:3-oxoacyl-[acyl-carrier-protein] synthase II